ncbi:TPA: hypothetical protein N0F65_004077 [Lagenidium giganteum]|uniref:RAVE complex protein Rav1 C-terminal domain-containing protein n=1 Tax=Lagenidium giganteum TaxID=4803 RepID=A0AAV2Z141_9STRA|nr:TPA: hypothetical protein N0F65_004077 [Lagenidium giganteum]
MVFRVEDSALAVCAPPAHDGRAALRVCNAMLEQNRFLFFANEQLLVVLLENGALGVAGNPRAEAKRPSQLELWQVWNANERIQCVRFNNHKKVARGALALCVEEGRGVLLMPSTSLVPRGDAHDAHDGDDSQAMMRPSSRHVRRSSSILLNRAATNDQVTPQYVKMHLHLQLPTWRESVRWKAEDRRMDRIEWVESGEDLLLIGAGEKITVWKIVDDAVQVYFQRSFALGDPGQSAHLFDASWSGQFLSTAGEFDRIAKVWMMGELAHDGSPVCAFLPHPRSLARLQFVKDQHTFRNRGNGRKCEMLMTLDKNGSVSIWRETVASTRSFVLWKSFSSPDYMLQNEAHYFFDIDQYENAASVSKLKRFGLLDHYWARLPPINAHSISDALLEEENVMAALCMFHYGFGSLDEARRNELYNQRMDGVATINSNLLGNRNGLSADTHAGETFIGGNLPLNQTFSVCLLYGVHENGDLCLFRIEFIPFSGVTPRVALLLLYSGLREHLANAEVYSISSSDYKDRENGSMNFIVEILFQPRSGDSILKFARLKLQAESSSFASMKNPRGAVCYTVQSCDVSDACLSILPAQKSIGEVQSIDVQGFSHLVPQAISTPSIVGPQSVIIANIDHRLELLRPASSLTSLHSRASSPKGLEEASNAVFYNKQNALFFISRGLLHAAQVTETRVPGAPTGSITFALPTTTSAVNVCYEDDTAEIVDELILVDVPARMKREWSASMSYFGASESTRSKDYCLVVGTSTTHSKLVVWVFAFEVTDPTEAMTVDVHPPPAMSLHRKTETTTRGKKFASVASIPIMGPYDAMFGTINTDLHLELWRFPDESELRPETFSNVDVAALIKSTKPPTTGIESLTFNQAQEKYKFRQFCFSQCGRVAVLVDDETTAKTVTKCCIMPVFESSHEEILPLAEDLHGQFLSITWTPPLSSGRHSELIFLTTSSIGAIRFHVEGGITSWSVAWSSSRLSVRPQAISSLQSFPQVLLGLNASITSVRVQDLSGLAWSTSKSVSSNAPNWSDIPAIRFLYHPINLLFLLARGSFTSLEKVLEHIQKHIMEHEKACYMRMMDDTELMSLPLLGLSTLFQHPAGEDSNEWYEERSAVFTAGKGNGPAQGNTASNSGRSAAPLARASDLFSMDFSAPRRYGGEDRADMLFAPPPAPSTTESVPAPVPSKSKLETNELAVFFKEHQSSLTFLAPEEREVFLNVVNGIKAIVKWERDSSKAKDEAALRFQASLLWPCEPEHEQAPVNRAYDPISGEKEEHEPPVEKTELGICSEQVCWAALSDHQTELLQECFPTSMMTWKEMKQMRIPFWLRSATKLAFYTEKVAQAEFTASKDPFRVALFYILLGKTKLLANLFKMGNESRIYELLSNDFSDERWKNAAIKNAYVLKAKQRFELSAAFFLLGGRVQEAVALAEHADPTMVLSFLIARISAKWDLQGDSDSSSSSATEFSMSGLSINTMNFGHQSQIGDSVSTSNDLKAICEDFLRTSMWRKARDCGDIYTTFLVKYFLEGTNAAVQCLLSVPNISMKCVFGVCSGEDYPYSLYWRTFGQSLVGACDLVRYLRGAIRPLSSAAKEQIVCLQTLSHSRLLSMGLNMAAYYQQRDFKPHIQQFTREQPSKAQSHVYAAMRDRILAGIVGLQADYLYFVFERRLQNAILSKSTDDDASFEVTLTAELTACVKHCGCQPDEVTEIRERVFTTVHDHFSCATRTTGLDTLVSHWSVHEGITSFTTPMAGLLENVNEKLSVMTSGDLNRAAPNQLFSKRVDQVAGELLTMATTLLEWLYNYYGKTPSQRNGMSSGEFVRVSTAAVYSIICMCCRYIKSPCCLYRALTIIYPHKGAPPKKMLDDLNQLAMTEVCISCSSILGKAQPSGMLLQDIPILFHVVQMVRKDVELVVAEVKTHRLDLQQSNPALYYSYCQYWTLLLTLSVNAMPSHVAKIAVEGISPACSAGILGRKLMQIWTTYNSNLCKYSSRHLLCEMADSYFRPLTSGGADSKGSNTPQGASGSPVLSPSTSSGPSVASPQGRDSTENRQLLHCTCDRCPWLIIMKLLMDKNEFLLRVNAQLDCCSEKLKDEINWGRLPDFPYRKAALTRSQRILLSAAAGKGATPRTSDLADLLERRMQAPTAKLKVECIYRSEVSIKSLCFNRATDSSEMVLCSSKGICRTACVDYSDGSKFQFKGMYANPHIIPEQAPTPDPPRRKTTVTAPVSLGGGNLGNTSGMQNNSGLSNASASTSDAKVPTFKPTAVRSHPYLPLFVSGNHKGKVHLWSYDSLSAVCSFETKSVVATHPLSPTTSARRDVKKIQFDNLGQQMGAVDTFGKLFVWKFGHLDREVCYREIDCHDKGAKSLTFVNSGTCLATVGSSSDKRSVCVWDLLLPASKAMISAPLCHPAGAASVVFSSAHQLLISGGEGGSISVFDVRQRRVLHTVSNAHETAITTLELHPGGHCVLSGSASGDIKIWSLPIFREVVAINKVHAKPSFLGGTASNLLGDAASNMAINVTSLSWGVTDAVATDDYFYTSGTDGSIQRCKVPSLGSIF